MKDPKIYYVNSNLIPIFKGICLPYVGIIIREKHRGDETLIAHEKVHLKQIKRMTLPLYIIRYVVQLVFIGYDSMPMELEARQGEANASRKLWNYRKRHWNKKV